jgi:DNA polymerase II small subunit/DNA polymerase delta subunit B
MEAEILKKCAGKGFLLDRELLGYVSELSEQTKNLMINFICSLNLNSKIISLNLLSKNKELILSKLIVLKDDDIKRFFEEVGLIDSKEKELSEQKLEKSSKSYLKVIQAPAFIPRKIVLADFVKHFRSRYEQLKKKLEKNNFEDLTTIRKMRGAKGTFTIIVMISNKRTTKNKNLILEVEDLTGSISVLVNKNKEDIMALSKGLVLDEVVALNVSNNGKFLYCNSLVRPQIVLPEKKNATEDIWVAFTSDIHVGSTFFLEKNLFKFIKWLNGTEGCEEYKDLIKKIKYLFIGGDLIDGVSHYPGQEKYLTIKDTKGQYKKLYEYLSLIRSDLKIVACSGDHDAVWVGEPQPIISERWAEPLYKMDNLLLVPSP